MFSGGSFSQASVFALGIMPYISASIVIQLLGIVFPYYQKLQKEGESGRRKMNQHTRYLTVLVLILQAPTYLINLHHTGPFSICSFRTFLPDILRGHSYSGDNICYVAGRKNH